MFNIKKSISLGLVVLMGLGGLAGCKKAEGENASDETKAYLMEVDYSALTPEQDTISYRTKILKAEDYELTYTDFCSPIYVKEELRLDAPYGSKQFIEYKVKTGDFVKEGDAIMTYRITFDEVDMAQTRLNLLRTQERFDKFVKDETKRLAEYLAEIAKIPSTEPRFAELLKDYEEQMKVFEEQKETKIEELEKIQEKVDWFEHDGQVMEVKAPMDGRVEVERNIWWLGHDTYLGSIFDPMSVYYHISDNQKRYSYGQKVVATHEEKKGVVKTYTGTVISNQALLSSGLHEEGAVIKMDFPDDLTVAPDRLQASITTTKIKDAILIPKTAVTYKNKQYYFSYLTERGVERHYIDIVMETKQEYLVLDPSLIGLAIILK